MSDEAINQGMRLLAAGGIQQRPTEEILRWLGIFVKELESRDPEHDHPDRLKTAPCIYIQWKGTDVCADIYCRCGFQGHIDGSFLYTAKCSQCGQCYVIGDHVRMTPVESVDNPYMIEEEDATDWPAPPTQLLEPPDDS